MVLIDMKLIVLTSVTIITNNNLFFSKITFRMSRVSSLLLLVLFLSPLAVNSYRILGVFPHPGLSHFFFFEAVLKSLSEAGHELVVISPFPNKNPPANYTDYSLGNSNTLVNSVNLEVTTLYVVVLLLR